MTDAIFYVWARDCFLPTIAERPFWTVFLMDSFGAHCAPSVLQLFRDHKVHIVGVPPHAIEILQTLDLITNTILNKALSVVIAPSHAQVMVQRAIHPSDHHARSHVTVAGPESSRDPVHSYVYCMSLEVAQVLHWFLHMYTYKQTTVL